MASLLRRRRRLATQVKRMGMECSLAYCAEECLQYLETADALPDVILLDVRPTARRPQPCVVAAPPSLHRAHSWPEPVLPRAGEHAGDERLRAVLLSA